eukprot:127414-Hanusia_phi.AAC.1
MDVKERWGRREHKKEDRSCQKKGEIREVRGRDREGVHLEEGEEGVKTGLVEPENSEGPEISDPVREVEDRVGAEAKLLEVCHLTDVCGYNMQVHSCERDER